MTEKQEIKKCVFCTGIMTKDKYNVWKCGGCGYLIQEPTKPIPAKIWFNSQKLPDISSEGFFKRLSSIDIREISEEYFHPMRTYSTEECELFQKPTKFKHFKHRVELLIKRSEENRLCFLPLGEDVLFLAIKLYVLNLIPTQNKALTREITEYLASTFGEGGINELIDEYAEYLRKFQSCTLTKCRFINTDKCKFLPDLDKSDCYRPKEIKLKFDSTEALK